MQQATSGYNSDVVVLWLGPVRIELPEGAEVHIAYHEPSVPPACVTTPFAPVSQLGPLSLPHAEDTPMACENTGVDPVGLWRSEMRHRRSERYVDQVAAILGRLAEHAGKPLAEVTRDDVAAWLGDLRDQATARTANNNLAAARGWFRWAVQAEVATRDPTQGVAPYKAVRREGRAFTADEVVWLVEAAADDERQDKPECVHRDGSPVMRSALYRFLAVTGMRAGEAQVLRWRDWEFDATPPVVVLQPGLTAKGHAGRRVVLSPDDAGWFRWLKSDQSPDELCFERPAWGVIQRDLRAAGIPEMDKYGRRAGLHSFRRYVGTALAAAGLSPKVAQARLGHSTITTTLRHYTDLGDCEQAAEVLQLGGCPVEKTLAPLTPVGLQTYSEQVKNHPRHSVEKLDRIRESADTPSGMRMNHHNMTRFDGGQSAAHLACQQESGVAPPQTASLPRYRFESCIAHWHPQDNAGVSLTQSNTEPLSDGGVVVPRGPSADSPGVGAFSHGGSTWQPFTTCLVWSGSLETTSQPTATLFASSLNPVHLPQQPQSQTCWDVTGFDTTKTGMNCPASTEPCAPTLSPSNACELSTSTLSTDCSHSSVTDASGGVACSLLSSPQAAGWLLDQPPFIATAGSESQNARGPDKYRGWMQPDSDDAWVTFQPTPLAGSTPARGIGLFAHGRAADAVSAAPPEPVLLPKKVTDKSNSTLGRGLSCSQLAALLTAPREVREAVAALLGSPFLLL